MNDLSPIFSIVIKILKKMIFFKKEKNIKKQKDPGAWENLELCLWLQLQEKHSSGELRLRAP